MDQRGLIDNALLRVGLPVRCGFGDCGATGFVKPKCVDPKHAGWYKSKLFRRTSKKRWYCPEHYEEGRAIDNRFYENYKTPDPYPEPKQVEETVDELYKLID